jgi:predicted AlkP superfamily phosphohydrolase/phosphomutase
MRVEKILIALVVVVLIVTGVIAVLKVTGDEEEPTAIVVPEAGELSLVVIGIQGLEASMVERLTADGRLPNLARLIAGGATGSYATLGRNVDARIVWTSLVTGMLPENQGVGGKKLSRRGEMVDAPLVPQSRTVGTFWTFLADAGERSGVLGWPGTWPVEEIDGIMVGPHSTYILERKHGGTPSDAVHPPSWYERLDSMVLDQTDFTRRDLSRFVDLDSTMGLESLVGQNYIALATANAADRSVVDLANAVAAEGDVRDLFVCLVGTDVVSQRFWHYMDTEAIEQLDVDESERRLLQRQIEALGETVERYYDHVDELVGELARLAGDAGTVAVITDHGYAGIPLNAAGKPLIGTNMHSEEGMWVVSGPRVKTGATARHGALIDVAPTIMAAAGVEIPEELDGEAHMEVIAHQR